MPFTAGTALPVSSPRAITLPAKAQERPKNSAVSLPSLRSPPKAISASNTPAAALTAGAAKKPSPGRNTAAA